MLEAYEINCAQHLQDLSEYVNGEYRSDGNNNIVVVKEPHKCVGLTFRQTADIDFEPTSAWDDYNSDEHNLFAIGCEKGGMSNGVEKRYSNYFSGTYDGQGHTISGIRIYSNGNYTINDGYKGLFGCVNEGTVQNVTIANARIAGTSSIGGIVGDNSSSTVSNCHAAHDVAICARKGASDVGGIVGLNYNGSNVTDCTSAAVITAIDVTNCQKFGGIAGSNSSGCTISGCTAAGVILPSYGAVNKTGAIVGKYDGTLSGNIYHSSLVGTSAFNIGTGVGEVAGTTLDNSKLFLYDDRDNTTLIDAYAKTYNINSSTAYGGTAPNVRTLTVTLKGRTLYKDGGWNTLCLPFKINGTSSLPYNLKTDVSVMELDNSTNGGTAFDATTGTLTLNFKTVGTNTEITKGKPYIIKWTSGEDIADPVFNNVDGTNMTANTTTVKSSDNYVTFRGTYDPVTFEANDRTKLFLGSANTLYYPSADVTVNAFRAYFQLNNGLTAGDPAAPNAPGVRTFNLNFGEESTGISSTPNPSMNGGEWYDLQGRRLNTKPTASGLYIHNGLKVAIK